MRGMQDRRIGRGNGRPSAAMGPAATAALATLCFACGCTSLLRAIAAGNKAYPAVVNARMAFAEKASLVRAAQPERWARRKRLGRRGKQVMAIGVGVAVLGLATVDDEDEHAPMPGMAMQQGMGMVMGGVAPGAIIILVGAAFPDYDDYIRRQSRKLMVGVGPTGASLAYRF